MVFHNNHQGAKCNQRTVIFTPVVKTAGVKNFMDQFEVSIHSFTFQGDIIIKPLINYAALIN